MSRVAREFGVSTAMVCYLLECSPLDRPVDRKQTQLALCGKPINQVGIRTPLPARSAVDHGYGGPHRRRACKSCLLWPESMHRGTQ